MAVLRVSYIVSLVIFTVVLVIVIRTAMFSHKPVASDPCMPSDLDFIHADDTVITRFQKAISFETISYSAGNYNRQDLLKLQQFIFKEFSDTLKHPLVEGKIIGDYSLLLSIKGSNPSLKPYLIASHFDVVPATNESWEVPPFEGRVKDGFIWGRGTLDVKNGFMGSLEALQFLLKLGHKPQRSFFLAFGHDEEVAGKDGAKQIAAYLKSQGIQLEFLVDEGTTIVKDIVPGMKTPYALVGVVEKGFMTVELRVRTAGGHSSMPPKETSIGILANAVSRLEACSMPVVFDSDGPVREMFESFASEVPIYFRVVMANLWLFSPLLTRILERKPPTNALIRTTTAVTRFNAGIKDNVIAPLAKATVNHRVHPSNTIEEVLEHDRRCINDDRVEIRVSTSQPPSNSSRWDKAAFGFQVISKSIRQVFPDVGVAPGLMIANTDTWHYRDLTDAIYRFMPSVLEPEDFKRIHGFNERIGVKNYEQTINYFYHLIKNADATEVFSVNQHVEL